MPFEKGIGSKIYKNVGRKGYEVEQSQLETMRRILDKDLKIIERIQDQEVINETDKEKLAISQSRVSKYLDKLHVSKSSTDITSLGESIKSVLVKFVNGSEPKEE